MVGLITKGVKLPGHTILLALGILYWLVLHIMGLFKKQQLESKWQFAYHFLGLASGFWMAYVFSLVKFLPQQTMLLGLAAILSTGAVAYGLSFKQQLKYQMGIFGALVLMASCLSVLPKHDLYFALNVKYNQKIHKDYRTLDKYSWFLTRAEQYDQALKANKKAQLAAEVAIYEYNLSPNVMNQLQVHRTLIKKQNWKRYEEVN